MLILLKNSVKPGTLLLFFSTQYFIFLYTFYSFFYSGNKRLQIKIKNGLKISLRTRSSDLEVFMQHYIYKEMYAIKSVYTETPVFILDAGANIGLTSLILSELYPEATIVAIELEGKNYEMLEINCASLIRSGKIVPLLGAFYPHQSNNLKIISNPLGEWAYSLSINNAENNYASSIRVFTYDDICSLLKNNKPDLIKMDIEGSELAFFKDKELFKRILNDASLLIELHDFETYKEYFGLIKEVNYETGRRLGEFWFTDRRQLIRTNN